MPLTKRQELIAVCPYHYKAIDVYNVMFILGEPGEDKPFGENSFYVLLELHKAAVTKNIPIPRKFMNLMQKIKNHPEQYPNIQPRRRVHDVLPPNS